jgi:SSS family solute:Na+ symporter
MAHAAMTVTTIAAYLAVLTFVALKARAAHQFEEFSLAGRSLTLPLVFGSLAATYVGGAFSIGFVGKGFATGFVFLILGLAFSLQNILVGFFVAPRLRALKDCHTLGDVIYQKYNRTCQIIAGVISVGLCAGFAGVMIKAGGGILADIFGIPFWCAVILVCGVTTLYTTVGGLRASVITDAFQFTTFAILLPLIFLWLLFQTDGGLGHLAKVAGETTSQGWASFSGIEIVGWITAFFLGETLIPPNANRALGSKSTRVSRNGFLLAGLFSAIWFTVVLSMGVLASIRPEVVTEIMSLSEGAREDQVLLILIRTTLPFGFYALLLVVLLSIIMSSLDSLLNAGAVSFTQDIYRFFTPPVSDHAALIQGRWATVTIAVAATAGALLVPSIIEGLLFCYSIWAPAVLPALLLGLWMPRPRPLAGILSMLAGSLSGIFFTVVLESQQSNIPPILPALAIALMAYLVGHYIRPSQPVSDDGGQNK